MPPRRGRNTSYSVAHTSARGLETLKASCTNSFALFLTTKNYHGVGDISSGAILWRVGIHPRGGRDYHMGVIFRRDIFRGDIIRRVTLRGRGGFSYLENLEKNSPKWDSSKGVWIQILHKNIHKNDSGHICTESGMVVGGGSFD